MPSLAGSFLVARPVLKDPSFAQSVVLLLQHGGEGAFGLVINRPALVEGPPFPVYPGGPCESEGLLMLHGQPDWVDASSESEPREIAPGIFLGDASCLSRIGGAAAGQVLRFRMFAGFAGWGPDQLEGELTAGAWAVVPASGQHLFDSPLEDLWTDLIPATIPQPSLN
jgi:putative transcriptional regulator